MAVYEVTETRYKVQKIKALTNEEYLALKRRFLSNPNYDMTPEHSFAKNNIVLTVCLIGFPIGVVLAAISEVFSFMPVICGMGLFFGFFTGTTKSAANFKRFQKDNREYFSKLKKLILNTSNVEEFNIQLLKLNNKYE